jgi:hypothetical protein
VHVRESAVAIFAMAAPVLAGSLVWRFRAEAAAGVDPCGCMAACVDGCWAGSAGFVGQVGAIACETRRSATEPAFGFGAEAKNLCGLVTGWESHSLNSGRLQAAGIAKDASPEP